MAKAKKPAKKAEKKASSKRKTKKVIVRKLNDFQLRYARKLKFTPGIKYLLMEFVMLALNLSGDSTDDKALARKIMHELKRT